MSSAPVFSILARGPWTRGQVHARLLPGRIRYSAPHEEAIALAWEASSRDAAANGRTLFPGEILGLTRFDATSDHLSLDLHRTDYRELVGTNLAPASPAGIPMSNALGLSLIVLAGDVVLLHRRGAGCYEWPLAIDTPGGHLEPGKHFDAKGVPSLALGAQDELEGELGVRPDEIESLSFLGLARQTETGKPQIVIALKILPGVDAVRERIATARESFETNELLPVSRGELAALARSEARVSPAGRAAMVLASEVLP